MPQDHEKPSSNFSLVPAAAIKLAQQANREHERATRGALKAIEHAIKAGEALLRARELCDYGQWDDFIGRHFNGSMRTAQKYMRLARNWQKLATQDPAALSSQKQAVKALTAILVPEDAPPQSAAQDKCAQGVRISRKTGARRGPVWRASGPFVREALNLVSSVEASLAQLAGRGYPVGLESMHVRDVLKRLQAMIDGEIDEAEALQASGERTFVADQAAPAGRATPRAACKKEDDDDLAN